MFSEESQSYGIVRKKLSVSSDNRPQQLNGITLNIQLTIDLVVWQFIEGYYLNWKPWRHFKRPTMYRFWIFEVIGLKGTPFNNLYAQNSWASALKYQYWHISVSLDFLVVNPSKKCTLLLHFPLKFRAHSIRKSHLSILVRCDCNDHSKLYSLFQVLGGAQRHIKYINWRKKNLPDFFYAGIFRGVATRLIRASSQNHSGIIDAYNAHYISSRS